MRADAQAGGRKLSYKAGHPGVSQPLKLSKYAKKKISIHMSCGWVVNERLIQLSQ